MQLYDWQRKHERPDFTMRRDFEKAYRKALEGQGEDPAKLPPDAYAEIAWSCFNAGFMNGVIYSADTEKENDK